jgi:CheY-like chemotaxis protein
LKKHAIVTPLHSASGRKGIFSGVDGSNALRRNTLVESVPMSERKQDGTSTILVVEDEWLVREMIVDHLRDAGWNVIEAENGEDALACLENGEEIDVVFTDIRLNGTLNGWDVGEACRRAAADLPVIYASGNAVEPAREVEGSLFFQKPYEPEHIRLACERLYIARRYNLDK